MSFLKGIMLGTVITAGTMMACSEEIDDSKRKIMKKGKQVIRKIRSAM